MENRVYDSQNNVIGHWTLKSVKYSFVYEMLKPITFSDNPFKDSMHRKNSALNLVNLLNRQLPKKCLYRMVLEFIQSEIKSKETISIVMIVKHFCNKSCKINRDLIVQMCKEGYLGKSYHKVSITKKGIDLIK